MEMWFIYSLSTSRIYQPMSRVAFFDANVLVSVALLSLHCHISLQFDAPQSLWTGLHPFTLKHRNHLTGSLNRLSSHLDITIVLRKVSPSLPSLEYIEVQHDPDLINKEDLEASKTRSRARCNLLQLSHQLFEKGFFNHCTLPIGHYTRRTGGQIS
jgi:hypothetical protein